MRNPSIKERKAKRTTEDSVFLAQILDRILLLLIHPSGGRQEHKAKRVQGLQHRFAGYHPKSTAIAIALFSMTAFNKIRFFGYYAFTDFHRPASRTGKLRRIARRSQEREAADRWPRSMTRRSAAFTPVIFDREARTRTAHCPLPGNADPARPLPARRAGCHHRCSSSRQGIVCRPR